MLKEDYKWCGIGLAVLVALSLISFLCRIFLALPRVDEENTADEGGNVRQHWMNSVSRVPLQHTQAQLSCQYG